MEKLFSAFDVKYIFLTITVIISLLYFFQNKVLGTLFCHRLGIEPQVIVIVKDAEERIEGIVRSYYENSKHNKELWVVDKGSQDQTSHILQKMTIYFPGIRILDVNFMGCFSDTFKQIDGPAALFLDMDKIDKPDALNFTNFPFGRIKCRNRSKNL